MEEIWSSVLHHIYLSKKDEMHIGMANSPFEASHSRGTEKKTKSSYLTIIEFGFRIIWRIMEIHNTSDDTKAEFKYCFIIH